MIEIFSWLSVAKTFDMSINLNNSKNFVLLFLIPACFGCLIFVTNIILAFSFTHKRQLTKSTFVFLTNLALSDVLYGLVVAVRPLLSYISQQPVVLMIFCRVLTGTALMTAVQSVLCTLLISVQVGIILLLKAIWHNLSTLIFCSPSTELWAIRYATMQSKLGYPQMCLLGWWMRTSWVIWWLE